MTTEDHQFRALVEAVEEYAIFRLDPDGHVVSWNAGAEDIKGYAEADILGNHFSTFYTEEDREAGVPEENLATAADQGSVEDEGWRVRADGSRFWAHMTITAIRDDDGDLEGFAKVTRDMTERRHHEKQRERALAETEHRYRTLVEHFPDGAVGLFDEDLRYTAVGGQLLDQVGLSPEERVGELITDVYPDDIVEQHGHHFQTALEGEAHAFEAEFHDRHLYNQTLPVRNADDEVYAGMLVAQDITERKEREQELEQYESIIQSVNEGVYVVDEDRNFQWVNQAYVELLGYARDELIGENASKVVADDELLREVDAVAEEEGYESIPRMDVALVTKDGERVPVEAASTVLPEGDRDGWFRAGVIRDITERKQYEQRLEELVDDLEESNERLEQFAHVASHDLQEPLRMVATYVQLLQERYSDDLDEDAEEFIDFAVEGTWRMREMIDDLLAYSRVKSEAAPLEPTDTEAVVENVLRDLELRVEETDAEIDVGSLPRVTADRNQLEQVFQNLVSNALKYRGADPPRIEISADRDGGEWVFQVADNGIGIDPAQTDQIFEVFERLHTDEEYSGTGIGLALCRKIVDRHGGDIWVESEPGEGSTFYFTIPAEAP